MSKNLSDEQAAKLSKNLGSVIDDILETQSESTKKQLLDAIKQKLEDDKRLQDHPFFNPIAGP